VDGRATGAYAHRAVCTAAQVHHLPSRITFTEGAGVGVPYITAWRALFEKGRAVPGETVLIHGASGAVGVGATQIARAAGLRVFGTAGTERGRQLVREQGAHEVFDHTSPDYDKDILAGTDGRGVDLVIEMLANVNLVRDLEMIARRGRIMIVGNRGALELNPRAIMAKDLIVTGTTLPNMTPAESRTALAGVTAALATGVLRPVVGRELPLAEAAAAHQAIMAGGARGKMVLVAKD
jgi:NADPH2:quinone reductase